MKSSALVTDLLDALDGELTKCERNREALLGPYETWPDEREVGDVDSKSISPKRRHPRTLGDPVARGSIATDDPLPVLGKRLVAASGSAAPLARVSRATEDFGQLLLSYEAGLCSGMPVKEWRKTVAKSYDAAVRRIDEAREAVEAWKKTAPKRAPNSAVLKDQEFIYAETMGELLNVKIDAARKAITSGRYGKFVQVGKHKALRRTDFDAAIAAQLTEAAPKKVRSKGNPLRNLPTRPRGRGRRGGSKKMATSNVEPLLPPPTAPASTAPPKVDPPGASTPRPKKRP